MRNEISDEKNRLMSLFFCICAVHILPRSWKDAYRFFWREGREFFGETG